MVPSKRCGSARPADEVRSEPITFLALEHRICVSCAEEADERAIRAAWAPALELWQRGPAVARDCIEYTLGAAETRRDGELVQPELSVRSRVAAFERDLLDELPHRLARSTLLHAGAVLDQQRLVLLVGESGAGKSTFTRQFLRAGAHYLSDDFLALEGSRLFGSPRSVQFDSVPRDEVPAYHFDADVTSYLTMGNTHVVPVHAQPHRPVREYDAAARPVVVVRLARAAVDSVVPLRAIETLAALHAATLTLGTDYSGGLDHARGVALTWNRPEKAFELLREWLTASSMAR